LLQTAIFSYLFIYVQIKKTHKYFEVFDNWRKRPPFHKELAQKVFGFRTFLKNHVYTASPALSFSALLTICPVELPSSPAGRKTKFKFHSALILMSDNVKIQTPYSSVSFPPIYLPSAC
jgi:hypothetical protein